jgi:hypothetical protein
LSGRPVMWAPQTTTSTRSRARGRDGSGSGTGWLVAPTGMPAAACRRCPSASRRASWNAGATSDTPNGSPSGRKPAGIASAARSSRFTKVVKRPRRAFWSIGSARTSAIRGMVGAVGVSARRPRPNEPSRVGARGGGSTP